MDSKPGWLPRFHVRRTAAQRSATRDAVISSSVLTGSYLAMNAAATLIASLGLLQNSPAVIIGAMLIAMLFGPIMGIALGLAEGDLSLIGRSCVSEAIGAAVVLGIGYLTGIASHRLLMGSEILSRTAPNLLDLLIGLVGGLAGGFTFVSTGLTGVVVGVAIAISLVPPLASCGILLAHHLPGLAAGAFLLFLANFTAIAIGAMVVFWLAGHRTGPGQARSVLVPRLISLALLGVLGVHFTVMFRRTVAHSLLENGVRRIVSGELTRIPGARLVNVTLGEGLRGTIAWVVVRAPRPVSPEQVARLNDLIDRDAGSRISLHVRSVITEEATRDGYVYEPQAFPSEDPREP